MSASMVESCTSPSIVPTEIDGSFPQARKFASKTCLAGEFAKLTWDKPDTAIAELVGVSDRAARDYISGKVAMPSAVYIAMWAEAEKRRRRQSFQFSRRHGKQTCGLPTTHR